MISYQDFKTEKKAFSIIELIFFIIVLAIIINFAVPKFKELLTSSNKTKLKSQYTLIQQAIVEFNTKHILLGENKKLHSLDEAAYDLENQKLFTKLVSFPITSTSSREKKEAFWIKKSDKKYDFVLSNKVVVKFELKNEKFLCKSPFEVCQGLQ